MKILHIINSLGCGGAERVLEDLVLQMNKLHDIQADVLILTNHNNTFDKRLIENNINVDIVQINKLHNPINALYICSYLNKEKYDVVHAHLFPSNYWLSIAARLIIRNKPKIFLTEHSTYNKRRKYKFLRFIERYIYSNYDKIVSVSYETQKSLVAWLNPNKVDINKFATIENGINLEKFKMANPYSKFDVNAQFDEDIKLVCMVGRFVEAKDQYTLIKAMKNLPKDIHLLLIGEGPLKGKNINFALELGVSDRVHFLGFREDIDRLYKTSDIVVMSSNWEGFGLVAVEAMAAGKPIIASDIPGLRDVVEGAGILFMNGDSESLAEAIYRLIFDQIEYIRLSKLSALKADKYSIEKMVQSYIRLYCTTLDIKTGTS